MAKVLDCLSSVNKHIKGLHRIFFDSLFCLFFIIFKIFQILIHLKIYQQKQKSLLKLPKAELFFFIRKILIEIDQYS